MLIIRREQMRVFDEAQVALFRLKVMAHVERTDPEAAQAQGDGTLERIIGDAVAAAVQLRFSHRDDVLRYVLLIYLLGPGFESNPAYPWARETFDDPETTLRQKLDILCVFGEHLVGPRFRKVMPRRG